MRKPKATIAALLFVLAALAGMLTYTGFLVVGALAWYLDIGRFFAGLLLGMLFARIPWLGNGKLRTVGLLPTWLRRPVMLALLAMCLVRLLPQGDYVPAAFVGVATVFLLAFPWIKRAVSSRIASSLFQFPGKQKRADSIDGKVIDADFREVKD